MESYFHMLYYFHTQRRRGAKILLTFAPSRLCVHFFNHFLTLNDQVTKNSATTSPAAFLPVDPALTCLASPEAIASSIALLNNQPSLQVNIVLPVAFLKYSDS